MTEEDYIEDYKGQSIMVYGSGDKWSWQVIIFDEIPIFKGDSSAVLSPKSYSTKEKAIGSAREHIDKVLKDKKLQLNTSKV